MKTFFSILSGIAFLALLLCFILFIKDAIMGTWNGKLIGVIIVAGIIGGVFYWLYTEEI